MSDNKCTCCNKQMEENRVVGENIGNPADIPGEPETPLPETPLPETPQDEPETPLPETPQSETPQGETPQGETPLPETPQGETPQGETPQGETPQSEPEAPQTKKETVDDLLFEQMDRNSAVRPRGLKLKKDHPPFPSGFKPPKTATDVEYVDGTRLSIFNLHLSDDIFQKLLESRFRTEIDSGEVKIIEPSYEYAFCITCERLSYCGEDYGGPSCVGCFIASNVDQEIGFRLERALFNTLSDTFHSLYFE